MPEGAQSRSEIRSLLAAEGHRPNMRHGQNFLADPNIVRKIVEVANVDHANVLEIGTGTGTLTAELAKRATAVVSYEIDATLLSIAAKTVGTIGNVELRGVDAASIDFGTVLDGGSWIMVSNLPYNVGTGIVLDALRSAPQIERFVIMVQSEVADRMLAPPGSKIYGIPSVIVGLHAVAESGFRVAAPAFEPRPRVASAVVVLDRVSPSIHVERAIELASVAFGQRRKMLRRSLVVELPEAALVMHNAGIDPTCRAEDLSPLDYVAIAEAESRL